ncbi:MAG: TonB-dependent receptor [Paludibacteraceae bacterium]|nr:TonB-dependent receptor [Paludibacteraceae bacterium]
MKHILSVLAAIFALSLSAQTLEVNGVVLTDDSSEPAVGANVVVKGTTLGTITDIDGRFSLSAKKGDIILFSYVGYKTEEVRVNGSQPLRVTLHSDSEMLEEVVAVGYGKMRKQDLTGAIASVSADELTKTPAANITTALQGRAAGVTVTNGSGQPGDNATIRIRGIGSAIAGNDPLYVVDGVITSDISFLSASDIESMQILKDASSAAIYGSRGANGVIIITTKSGSQGKANISFDAYWGIQNRWKKLPLMGANEMVDTKLRIAIMKDGVDAIDAYKIYNDKGLGAYIATLTGSSPYFPTNFDYANQNTDWQDEVFNSNAFMHNYNLGVDGGSDKGHYALSANYFEQNGTIIGSNYKRLSLRINADWNVRKWLTIGEHLSFVTSSSRRAMNNSSSPGASILSAALAMAPWDPTVYPEGSVNINGEDISGKNAASSNFKNVTNPISMVSESFPSSKPMRLLGDIYIDIKPIKQLSIRPSISMDLNMGHTRNYKNAYDYSVYDRATLNYLSASLSRSYSLLEETTITYADKIGAHNFSAMIGQTWSEYNYYSISGSGANILNPVETNRYLNKTTENRTESSDSVSRTRRMSALARFFYSYDDRYMATINFRADASSVFQKNPWGFFPSASLAWRLSQEPWLRDQEWLDNLKLRLGWGRVGNDANLSNSTFLVTIGSSNSVFYGYPLGMPNDAQEMAYGAAVLTQANIDGKWETNEQWDLGIDFNFWNGNLSGTIDIFRRTTLDALLYVNAPSHVGNRYSLVKNVGNIRNDGVEFTLEHARKVGHVSYTIGGNMSFIRNRLLKVNGGSPLYSGYTKTDEGMPLGSFWGFEYEGIYQSDAEVLAHQWYYADKPDQIGVHAGDAKYRDIDNNGIINDDDKTYIGNPFPKFTYGINLGAEFYGVDIQLFFQGVYGNQIYNALRYRTEGAGNDCSLSPTMSDVWVGYNDLMLNAMLARGINYMDLNLENRNGTIPNPVGSPSNSYSSSRFVESGSYFRLKNLQIGYTFPKQWMQKAHLQRLRVYMTAANLFTATLYSGYDPEVGGGTDYGNYPQSRTFTFGLNANF